MRHQWLLTSGRNIFFQGCSFSACLAVHSLQTCSLTCELSELLVSRSETTSELKDHMDGWSSFEVVVWNFALVGKLLASENESNHRDLNTFLLLKSLLDLHHCIAGLEVERRFLSWEGLYSIQINDNLNKRRDSNRHEWSRAYLNKNMHACFDYF